MLYRTSLVFAPGGVGQGSPAMLFGFAYCTIGLRSQFLYEERARICHELNVMINAIVVCLRGARNLDVLFVYPGGNCLMERVSSRTGYNVMHVLRHVSESFVSQYEMEQRVIENMTGNAQGCEPKMKIGSVGFSFFYQNVGRFRPVLKTKPKKNETETETERLSVGFSVKPTKKSTFQRIQCACVGITCDDRIAWC